MLKTESIFLFTANATEKFTFFYHTYGYHPNCVMAIKTVAIKTVMDCNDN